MWPLSFQGDWGGQAGAAGRSSPNRVPAPYFNEGRPLWGRTAYTRYSSVRLSSVPSGDRSANPATYVCFGTQRSPASTSQSFARKRCGAEMLATPSGVSRAASSAFSCRCAVPGYQTGRSDYTRGQSPETGSLSRHLAVWEPLPSVSHRVLPAGFGFTSLVFLGDDAGLRTVAFSRRLRLMQSWCPLPRTYEGRPRRGRAAYTRYTVPVSPQCPQEIGLPTLPVFQGAAVSSEHTSQSLPPGNVAEPRCSPPLRGSLQQLVRLFSCRCAVPGYQTSRSNYTGGQSRETGSLSRLFGSVETTAKCVSMGPAHCREATESRWVLLRLDSTGWIPLWWAPSRLW